LRILILGGTGNIGPHHVHAALRRGHQVAVFSRGKTAENLPAQVERLTGDRNGDLRSIQNRDWDAVLDLATFGPVWVRSLGDAMRRRIRHYTFVSTILVYDTPGNNKQCTDESSSVQEYKDAADPYSTVKGEAYGALKVLCEREAERQFPGRTLIMRPGYIVGPGDPYGFFTYWSLRMRRGGEILAPGDALARVQMIDVRDMAEWVIRLAEKKTTGTFNATGPAKTLNWATMLDILRQGHPVELKLAWIPQQWLTDRKVPLWSNLLFWPSEAGTPGFMHICNAKAVANGLTFHPLPVTARDTVAWYEAQPTTLQPRFVGQSGQQQNGHDTLEGSLALERQLLAEWHDYVTPKLRS